MAFNLFGSSVGISNIDAASGRLFKVYISFSLIFDGNLSLQFQLNRAEIWESGGRCKMVLPHCFKMNNQNSSMELNRRNFLGSFSSVMMLMGGVAITRAQTKTEGEKERYAGPPVNCAVIGCGQWGRDIITALGRQSRANVVAICDRY